MHSKCTPTHSMSDILARTANALFNRKGRLVLQNFAIADYFPYIIFSSTIFSPYFLQVGLLLQYVALFQSGS